MANLPISGFPTGGTIAQAGDEFVIARSGANYKLTSSSISAFVLGGPTTQLGAADVASGAVPQTLQVQSNTGASTTGPNFTIKGSAGTTAGGSIIFQTHNGTSYAAALTLTSARNAIFAGSLMNTDTISGIIPNSGDLFYIDVPTNGLAIRNNAGSYAQVLRLTTSGALTLGPTSAAATILPDAANTLALRNSTNAQTFNVYNTYTDASNYERGFVKWTSNQFSIGQEVAGSGTARAIVISGKAFTADTIDGYTLTLTSPSRTDFTINSVGSNFAVFNFARGGTSVWNYYLSNSTDDFVIQKVGTGAIATFLSGGNVQFRSASLIQFGGATSSFPALKRSSATLQVRLADDSAYSNIAAAQLYSPPTALTSGATITWDANLSSVATLTLDQVGATLTISNAVAGGTYLVVITQGTGGNKTITTWTSFKWQGGAAPTLSASAGAIDVVTAVYDGTSFYATAQIGFA